MSLVLAFGHFTHLFGPIRTAEICITQCDMSREKRSSFNLDGIGEPAVKLAVMGTGGVGKTALTVRLCSGIFLDYYDPTIEDTYRKLVDTGKEHVMLEILDTAGTECFVAMRDLYIMTYSSFLLVFSVASLASFHDLTELYHRILQLKGYSNAEKVPIVLFANKCDLKSKREVSDELIRMRGLEWACPVIKGSALSGEGVQEAFQTLASSTHPKDFAEKKKKKRKVAQKCVIS